MMLHQNKRKRLSVHICEGREHSDRSEMSVPPPYHKDLQGVAWGDVGCCPQMMEGPAMVEDQTVMTPPPATAVGMGRGTIQDDRNTHVKGVPLTPENSVLPRVVAVAAAEETQDSIGVGVLQRTVSARGSSNLYGMHTTDEARTGETYMYIDLRETLTALPRIRTKDVSDVEGGDDATPCHAGSAAVMTHHHEEETDGTPVHQLYEKQVTPADDEHIQQQEEEPSTPTGQPIPFKIPSAPMIPGLLKCKPKREEDGDCSSPTCLFLQYGEDENTFPLMEMIHF